MLPNARACLLTLQPSLDRQDLVSAPEERLWVVTVEDCSRRLKVGKHLVYADIIKCPQQLPCWLTCQRLN